MTDKTQIEALRLAEHYRNAIATACEGWSMPDGLRKHLESVLWNPPAPQQAGEMEVFGLQWPGEDRVNLSTVFDTEAEALEYRDNRCGTPGIRVVRFSTQPTARAAESVPAPQQEPMAYVHVPHYTVEGKVRPVVSFEKYQQDYDDGIYSTRIPLYTAPQPAPQQEPVTHDEELIERLYWEFDSQRKTTGEERLAFKGKLRFYASEFRQRSLGKIAFAPQPAPAPLSDDVVRDAARWRMITLISNELGLGPEKSTHTSLVYAFMDATDNGADLTGAVDAALAVHIGKE